MSAFLSWIRFGFEAVFHTVVTGIDEAPSRLIVAESMHFPFAKKSADQSCPAILLGSLLGVFVIRSSLWLGTRGKNFGNDKMKRVVSRRLRVFSGSDVAGTRIPVVSVNRASLLC